MELKPLSRKDENAKIDPRNAAEIEQWAARLGVPIDELKRAAERAGPRVGDIHQHLIGGFSAAGPTS